MPVYEYEVAGKKPRMIKAKDVTDALTFASGPKIKAIGAERMIELQEAGVTLEKVPDPTDPASYAPGGPLHGKTPPAGVKLPEAAEEKGGTDKVD